MRDETKIFWYGVLIGFVVGVTLAMFVNSENVGAQGVPGVLDNGQVTYQWAQPDGSLGSQNPLAVPRHSAPAYGRRPCP